MTVLSRTARLLRFLHQSQERRWFLPTVGLFPMCDYVLPFLPNQLLLAALSILAPPKWMRLAATFVLATGLGAFLTATAVQAFSPDFVDALFGVDSPEDGRSQIQAWIDQYGLMALVPLSMLPWPPRTAVLVCAFAGLSPASVASAVMIGRLLPVAAYAFLGAKVPCLLRRSKAIDNLLTEAGHPSSRP